MDDEQEITAPLEVEQLQAGWAVKSSARPKLYAYLVYGAKTDLGRVRENNEDKFDYMEPDEPSVLATKGRVFAVADGMGGHSAGQVAAEMGLNLFMRTYYADHSPQIETSLRRAVAESNRYILDVAATVPGRKGMGATLTAAIVRDDELFIAQVGDSRCYLLRGGVLQQVTEDHSWVAEQVRSGAMSEEQAEQSPFRNVITRSLGGMPDVEPDVTACGLIPGDRYLLCSDGLSGMVPFAELREILSQGSPSVAAWNLVDRANQSGGKDNITAFVIQVVDIQPWPDDVSGEADPVSNATAIAVRADDASERAAGASTRTNGQHANDAQAPVPVPTRSGTPSESGAVTRGGLMGRLFGR